MWKKLIPLALQFGMNMDDFLYEDEELFKAHCVAYMNRTSFDGWMYGKYNNIAHSVSLSNALDKDSKANYIEEPFIFDDSKMGLENEKQPKIEYSNMDTPLQQDKAYRDFILNHCW